MGADLFEILAPTPGHEDLSHRLLLLGLRDDSDTPIPPVKGEVS